MSGLWKIFLISGLAFLVAGGLLYFADRLGLGSFRGLPGDIVIKRGSTTFAFPIVTCLVVSVILTLLFRLFR